MNLNDFRCMRQGQVLSLPNPREVNLLQTYEQIGSGRKKALLMLHGYSSSPAVFRTLYQMIKGYDYIIAPVLPGHAQSLKAFAATTAQDWLNFVEQQCQALIAKYEQVDVLGLSLGGLLACHLSQKFSLNRLFLLAPALDLQMPLSGMLFLARSLKSLRFHAIRNLAAGNIHTPDLCEITYRQLPITTNIEILNLVQRFQWQTPKCQTDLFLGCYDEVVASWRVAKRFTDAPKTKIHWLKRSAHILSLDGDTARIIKCINAAV